MRAIFFCLVIFVNVMWSSAASAQSDTEVAFVTRFFDNLQPISIAANKEYCGYFGIAENGDIVATEPTRGDESSCLADEPSGDMQIIASYHTHGSFSYDFDSEVPSSDDLLGDFAEEVNGYISTPGGRIWFNSLRKERAVLLCGRNCTVSDSEFEADGAPPPNNSYNLTQLLRRESE